MSLGSGLEHFAKTCPNNFIDAGLAEENATMMAASMAHSGLIPVLFVYSTFLQRAYDELLHDIGRTKEHVVVCLDRSGIVSQDGDTHQGIFDLAYLSSIPGISILSPNDASSAISMLDYAINEVTGPVVIRYPKQQIEKVLTSYQYTPSWTKIGNGKKCIITYGILFDEVLSWVKDNNIDASIINAHSINPLDEQMLETLAKEHEEIIVYEEVIENGSLGSRILNFYNKIRLYPVVKLLNLKDNYLEVGTRKELMKEYHITLDDLKKVMDE